MNLITIECGCVPVLKMEEIGTFNGGRMMVNGTQAGFDFESDAEGAMERKFWAFHGAHPEVYKALVYFARQWRQRRGPYAFCGIKALYERARWELWVESREDEPPPKLSNNHTAFYARLIMERNRDLEDIFRLKRQKVQATFGPGNSERPPDEHIS